MKWPIYINFQYGNYYQYTTEEIRAEHAGFIPLDMNQMCYGNPVLLI